MMKKIVYLKCLVAALALSSCASTSTSSFVESNYDCAECDKAREYDKKGDVQSAIAWYRKGVAKGDPCSYLMLALELTILADKTSGAASEQYQTEGLALLRKLAEADFSSQDALFAQWNAQLRLSQFYDTGTHGPKDAQQAAYWEQKARETIKRWEQEG